VLKTLDNAEVRSRAMGRALKKVEALPDAQVPHLIPMDKDHDHDHDNDTDTDPDSMSDPMSDSSSPNSGGSLL
jgi:DNA recombination protein RmuC